MSIAIYIKENNSVKNLYNKLKEDETIAINGEFRSAISLMEMNNNGGKNCLHSHNIDLIIYEVVDLDTLDVLKMEIIKPYKNDPVFKITTEENEVIKILFHYVNTYSGLFWASFEKDFTEIAIERRDRLLRD